METVIATASFFAAKLSYEVDPADLAAARATGSSPVIIDSRSAASWAQGRIPGALTSRGPNSLAVLRRCFRT
jgi:rhodanese-related sulfurtransferase